MMKNDILSDLYSKQAAVIYQYLLRHGCRKEVAEEIVHDSFVKAFEHFYEVDPQKLTSWIFKVALNRYRNYIKKLSVREELLINEYSFMDRFSAGVDMDIEDNLLIKERANEILCCLNSLKDSYRNLLLLKYEMDLTYKEIGSFLGLQEQTVKTYLFRARKEFKKIWRLNNE